ncbi:DNA-binding transcriptional regulator, LysR family [Nocardioides scoriae]|uniref:DNA-binding transcriptional regulator, LysR family n=1 Tax=Nocardioides scoriae TaxID=642780 RepID=A0A1H1NF51_9ACTN|nr:LysR family transcriptional regulator [Nocardioides scoriae]SDR97039.1 DNA-binding transcriptional regulator, LysR family [Nocardioides scoriae]
MLDLRRLEALLAVARTGSVSRAAEELHYGQPTVSHHLRRLEAETGAVLLQRVGRGVRLTAEGRRLADRAEEVLGLLQRAETELADATTLRHGRVRLAAFPSATATLVPRLLAVLAEEAPGLVLELTEAEPPEGIALLRSGEVDLALAFSYPDVAEDPQLTVTELVEDPLFLVTDARRAPAGPLPDLAAYAGARWVTGCERCRQELLVLCSAAGFEPEVVFATDDYVAVQAMVAAGLGVSLLPGLALEAHRHPDVVVTGVPGAWRRIRVLGHGQPPLPPAVARVVTALVDVGASGAGVASSPR